MTSEKRILIRESRPECKFRGIHETTAGDLSWIDYLCCNPSIIDTNRECDDKRIAKCECKELNGLSRQEAIERMAKAIFKRDSVLALDIGFEDLIEQKQNVYRDFANVALNALLEVEK